CKQFLKVHVCLLPLCICRHINIIINRNPLYRKHFLQPFFQRKVWPWNIVLKNSYSMRYIYFPRNTCTNPYNFVSRNARMIKPASNTKHNLLDDTLLISGVSKYSRVLYDISMFISNATCNFRTANIDAHTISHGTSSSFPVQKTSKLHDR